MDNTKVCKQCGRLLHLTNYRSYYPRGASKAEVGRNTICRECESFNAKINRIYKSANRTEYQQSLLDEAAAFYRTLAKRGLEPKGRYAADVLGNSIKVPSIKSVDDAFDFMNNVLTTLNPTEAIVVAYNNLLSLDLTEEPDVYNSMLDDLEARSAGPDGRVKPEYRDIYMKVLERLNHYEDTYQW